ncbi:AmmeMemoRadiSam system protein B [Methyloceanibacter sp.]|uniref:AmmeMemoRadiSam system protein B n=1 Tax=Methyloceanibacter sp. TaxID=1965321 RepID=UPI002D243631|nr:AmmeMemoRadiSam system protein B [Methyloceanibacter sp.]HZP10388.1 AmmeMemoRadiSam system protein B [Methyloceanibacter sp.]
MSAPKPHSGARPPAVAGSFYPGEPHALENMVGALLGEVHASGKGDLLGLIAPHAGYMYSGPVAASAFAEIAGARRSFARVLLVGPPHYVPVGGIAASSAASFATPLGDIAVDEEAVASLIHAGLVSFDDRAHAPEHSLEVELPFLQGVLGGFTLIPLLVGDAAPQQVADVIRAVMDRRTLLVVSTDLSHYLSDREAEARDLATASTIERLDYATLGPYDACGYAALNGALCAAQQNGWRVARLDLRNSGRTSGDLSRVVGYGAWAFSAPRA